MNMAHDLPAVASAGVSPVKWLRWVARLWASGVFLLWGAFFVDHLEWFVHPAKLPPPWVFALSGLHLLMLIGLLIGWRWEAVGGSIVIASAVVFFTSAAGRLAVPFIALTIPPGILWLVCAWLSSRRGMTVGPG